MMKEFIAALVANIGGVIAVVSFWVWLATLLLWKIFAIAGAASFIYPAFWIMIVGAVLWLLGVMVMLKRFR